MVHKYIYCYPYEINNLISLSLENLFISLKYSIIKSLSLIQFTNKQKNNILFISNFLHIPNK